MWLAAHSSPVHAAALLLPPPLPDPPATVKGALDARRGRRRRHRCTEVLLKEKIKARGEEGVR